MDSKQTVKNMRNGDLAYMYKTNQIRADAAATNKHGSLVSAAHIGKYIAIQAKKIEPVEAYDEWLDKRNAFRGGNSKCTGTKLRRIVIMRRQGSTWNECGSAVGVNGACAKQWVEFLPFELSV